MKLSNDARTALISVLVNVVFITLAIAAWSTWEHLFKEDYLRNKKMAEQQERAKRFAAARPELTPEQKAAFKKRMEEFRKMRQNEMALRESLITVLKKNNASAAKIAEAECDLTLAKMRMMRRRRSAGGASGAEFVVRAFYAAKAAPAKVDMNSEESIRAAISDIQYKQQSRALRHFMQDDEFKHAAESWKKEQSDDNLRALCEAEKNVPEPMPRKRMRK